MSQPALRSVAPPLVSIIMPTRGRPELIVVAIQSVLAQSYARWELIVVNDGGPDLSDTIAAHNASGRIVYLHLPRGRGAPAARNAALAVAQGTYIAYLDDDDWYDADHIATLVASIEAGDHAVVYADSRRVVERREGDTFRAVGVQDPYHAVDFDRDALLVNNYIPILAVLHRRDLVDELGGFDTSFEVLEDWELWVRWSRKHDFHRVPKVTCNVRLRDDQSSTTTGRQRDHHPCARRIHERYPTSSPALLAQRAELLACLAPAYEQTPPTCSIVVAVGPSDARREGCLAAIEQATQGVSCEVLVVDPTRDASLAAALNRAAEAARGAKLVFVPASAVVTPYWLRALLSADGAVACAKILRRDGTVADVGWDAADALVPRLAGARAWCHELSAPHEVEVASTLIAIDRATFQALGGMDASFDSELAMAELSWRARAHGAVCCVPSCVAYSEWQPSAAQVDRLRERVGAQSDDAGQEWVGSDLVAQARAAMAEGSLNEAAELVAELSRQSPNHPETYLTRGVLEIMIGDAQSALLSFGAAHEAGAEDQRASLGKSMALTALGRHLEAWEVLAALAARHPDDEKVAHALFRAGTQLQKWDELAPILSRYLAMSPDDAAMRFAVASVCVRRGDTTAARAHYLALQRADPGFHGLADLARELRAPMGA